MLKKISQLTIAAFLLLSFGIISMDLASNAKAGGKPLSATLTGASEVPGPGDPDGSGMAWLMFNPGKEEVCVTIQVSGIGAATAAHIHEAVEGVAGPVVVALPTPDADGYASGCVALDREEVLENMMEPDEYYVNVHTADYPGGALRGQLTK